MSGGCPRHGTMLTKHRKVDGDIVFVCPKNKCGYKEDEDGNMLPPNNHQT